MNYTSLKIENLTTEQVELVIAHLAALGFDGFQEEDTTLFAFIPSHLYEPKAIRDCLSGYDANYSSTDILEQNWNAEWESQFQPVIVFYPKTHLPFCIVRADFHKNQSDATHEIIINPKMSFGTGHHATTYLMMEHMSSFHFQYKKVLDFGTGTGILSILAHKMGSAYIMAIDHDDWCITNARENFERNNCDHIDLVKDSTYGADAEQFDLALANINLNIIQDNLLAIFRAVKAGGQILFSGILPEDVSNLQKEIEEKGGTVQNIHTRDNWAFLSVKKS